MKNLVNSFLESYRRDDFLFRIFWVVILFFCFWGNWGTGVFSDDFTFIRMAFESPDLTTAVFPGQSHIHALAYAPVLQLYSMVQYAFFQWDQNLYDLCKAVLCFVCVFFMYRFFSLYFGRINSLTISFLVVFLPNHDSINYWMLVQHYLASMCFLFYSFYQTEKERWAKGIIWGIVGAFWGYSCPPFAIGLFLVFFLSKKLIKSLVFAIGPFMYLVYYVGLTISFHGKSSRIPQDFHLVSFFKQLTVQFITSIDANFLLSFWLKIYGGIISSSVTSVLIAVMLIGIFLKLRKNEKLFFSKNLSVVVGFILIWFSSLAMFAWHGDYPSIAFNVGNRVTVFAAPLAACSIFLFFLDKKLIDFIVFILILSITGTAQHWKDFGLDKRNLLAQMRQIKNYSDAMSSSSVLVINKYFSQLGVIDHIDFNYGGGVTNEMIYWNGKKGKAYGYPLWPSCEYKGDGNIYYKKENIIRHFELPVWVLDLEEMKLDLMDETALKNVISSLGPVHRHWSQYFSEGYLGEIIKKIAPNYSHHF